ncbi:MAG: sulfatase-like hydrolase/transferase [Polyangiaceae bacterium]|nr:sulfatase-like hydrolase/transferase [Polyangiaceae bacterium]
MRAAASSTAVAISNMWAGIDPVADYKTLHSAPLLWEFASAAGFDTAYWTSQNLLFGNARLYVQDLPIAHFISGSTLAPDSDTLTGASDEDLTRYVIGEWALLKEPFFAVVHFSNIHRPRRVDPARAPFQPQEDVSGRLLAGRNHYANAVYLSDLATAELVKHVRSTPSGARTVIVYTSDHAESLAEHNNEIEHSSTVFDEEVHVPMWIDAPPELLTENEKSALRSKRDTYLVQYDLAPTVLDLLGVWNAPEVEPYRRAMLGRPLTRPDVFDKPVPLTNVSWVWEYRLPNWGMILGSRKVIALANDDRYRCYDLAKDPSEETDLGESACADLVGAARARFQILPRDMPGHIRSRPDIWGRAP